jgi:hypothetical protein
MSSSNNDQPSIHIVDAQLPRDIPSQGEEHFLTVFCHAGGLKWCMHKGLGNSFAPTMFWYTPSPSQQDLKQEPCQALHSFLTPQMNEYFFGSTQVVSNMRQKAAEQAKTRAVPAVTVYFLTSGAARTEQDVAHLFRDVPVRLFRLLPEHFFPADRQRGGKLHGIMTADRLASLYAARANHASSRGVLILSGSDTLTYTAMDDKGIILGGGVSPGINMRFRALYDYGLVEDYPSIEWNELRQKIKDHVRSKQGDAVRESFVDVFSDTMEKGVVAGVISEVTGHVRNVIKQFLLMLDAPKAGDAAALEPPHTPAIVLIEGFDNEFLHDLLMENAADIIQPEPDATMPSKKDVEYGIRKNLTIYGVQHLLMACSKKDEPPHPDEELRERILGLRGAHAKNLTVNGVSTAGTYRCTVVNVIRADTLDDDMYELLYDANGEKEVVDVKGLYDAIRLYLEVGEDGPEVNTQEWVKQKKTSTEAVAKTLVQTNDIVKKRKEELDSAATRGGSVASAMASPASEKASTKSQKKRARDDGATKTKSMANSIKSRDPKEFLGRRVAKYFGEDLYFGYVDREKKDEEDGEQLWHVTYDDDDQEDYDHEDLKLAMLLYIEKEGEDPKRSKKAKK